MSNIRILPENVCDRIAAGEVIERPASIVKELMENSLDAGATRITVTVEDAGRKLICIQDNGSGMDEDDALLCLETHATSKIRTEDDIFAINTFGFRGEALPSIASVAKMSLRTRQKEQNGGFEVVIHGGKVVTSSPVGCAPGTEVAVRDLFFNTPARKKFLKTAATEERHISECVTQTALAHPDASFELKLDGRRVISCASGTLLTRIRELFGKATSEALIPVDGQYNGITVTGYISTRSLLKATRSEQRVFVNGRPVESPSVYRGIRDGFGPIPESGRHPVAILFLTLEPGLVDVNVHPAKREVRFRDDFSVIAAVRTAVTAALRAADPVIPLPQNDPNRSTFNPTLFANHEKVPGTRITNSLYPDFAPGATAHAAEGISELDLIMKQALVEYHVTGSMSQTPALQTLADAMKNGSLRTPGTPRPGLTLNQESSPYIQQETDFLPMPEGQGETYFPRAAQSTEEQTLFKSYQLKVLGVLENSYIIAVIANGVVLIDQHAAHERVLYEKILRGTDGTISQKLLFPIPLELSRANMQFVLRNKAEFEKAGFELDAFGDNAIKLESIPAALSQDNAGGMFLDMLDRILDRGSAQHLQTSSIATAACKAAVKAHDRLTLEECHALIKDLGNCELPFSCPHGRPTVLNITMNEIEHRFGRK